MLSHAVKNDMRLEVDTVRVKNCKQVKRRLITPVLKLCLLKTPGDYELCGLFYNLIQQLKAFCCSLRNGMGNMVISLISWTPFFVTWFMTPKWVKLTPSLTKYAEK